MVSRCEQRLKLNKSRTCTVMTFSGEAQDPSGILWKSSRWSPVEELSCVRTGVGTGSPTGIFPGSDWTVEASSTKKLLQFQTKKLIRSGNPEHVGDSVAWTL